MPIRIRPIIWLLFVLTCLGVLTFALIMPAAAPAMMQVHLDQIHPSSGDVTTITLNLTDPQGLPIEQANVIPSATMTNMHMGIVNCHVQEIGQGKYEAEFQLNMPGPWAITFLTHASGFSPLSQTIQVDVS